MKRSESQPAEATRPVALSLESAARSTFLVAFLLAAILGATSALAGKDDSEIVRQRPSYPLENCLVSGDPLGRKPVDVLHDGQLLRFCSKRCKKDLENHADGYSATVGEAVVASQLADYPLTTCPVSGEELGSMGDPVDHVVGTRLVRFCCAGCVPAFEEDPDAVMTVLDEAYVKAQAPDYGTNICPVMGIDNDALGEPFDVMYGTRLVRLCCESCVQQFWKKPDKHLKELDKLLEEPPSLGK